MQKHISFIDIATLFLILIIWGAAMSIAKMMFSELSPLLSLTMRTGLIGLIALCFLRSWPNKETMKLLLGFTAAQMVMNQALMWISLNHIDASTFTLLQQSGTLFTVLLGVFILKEIVDLKTIIGIIICIIGLLVVFGTPNLHGQGLNVSLALICSFFGAIGTLLLKKMGKIDIAALMSIPHLLATPVFFLFTLVLEDHHIEQLQDANWTKVSLILFYQIVFLNLALILWQRILARNGMTKVTPYLLLYPIFGVAFGILLLDEPFTTQLFFGGALVLAGAALMTLRLKQKSDKIKVSHPTIDDPEIYIEKIN